MNIFFNNKNQTFRYLLGTETSVSYLDMMKILEKSGKFTEYVITLKEQSTPTQLHLSNEKARKELGLVFHSVEEMLIDMVSHLRDLGMIQKRV